MLRLTKKKKKKKSCPERSRDNTLSNSNILFDHHTSDSKMTSFD